MQRFTFVLFFLLLSTSLPVLAAVDNVFDVRLSDQDEALFYMRLIFGDAVNFLSGGEVPSPTDTSSSIIGAMALPFNAGLTSLNMILVMYVFVTAVFDVGHKGEIDKNKYDTAWLPVRMALSILIITPISSGYNAMQMGVFFVAGAGIQTANNIAIAAVNHMSTQGSYINIKDNLNLENLLFKMVDLEVCRMSLNYENSDDPYVIHEETVIDKSDGRTEGELQSGDPVDYIDTQGEVKVVGYDYRQEGSEISPCGGFKFATYDSSSNIETDEFITGYTYDYFEVMEVLRDAAYNIAAGIIEPVFSSPMGSEDEIPESTKSIAMVAIAEANILMGSAEQKLVQNVVNHFRSSWGTDSNGDNSDRLNVTDNGFILLGSLYWELSSMTQTLLRIKKDTSMVATGYINMEYLLDNAPPAQDAFYQVDKYFNEERNIQLSKSVIKANEIEPLYQSVFLDEDISIADRIVKEKKIHDAKFKSSVETSWSNPISLLFKPVDDPMTTIVVFGQRMLIAAEVLFWAKVSMDTIALQGQDAKNSTIGKIGSFFTGGSTNIFFNLLIATAQNITGAITLMIFTAATFAIVCAVYIPAIPIVQWIIGIINYFAQLLEIALSAPVHAISHALPEGKGISGERAKTGYMLIFGLFLTPPLMVFGFFVALIMINIGGMLLLTLWGPFMEQNINSTGNGLLTGYIIIPLAGVGVYLAALITIIQRSFQFINEIKDKSLRMIGGGAENQGDSQAMDKASSTFSQSGGVLAGGVEGMKHKEKMDKDKNNNVREGDEGGSSNGKEAKEKTNREVASKE